MTTKKYMNDFYKKTKGIENIMVEKMFSDYVLYKNGKRIGVLFENKVLLVSTENSKKIFPDAVEEKTFDWGYYKLIHINYNEDINLLEKAIIATYDDLYFQKENVYDIAALFKSYNGYSNSIKKIYDLHITFLRFCYDKGLLKINPLDKEDRILHMNFTNNDLTEKGNNIFKELSYKWLVYTDKNDDKSNERTINVNTLEKYYIALTDNVKSNQ
jgi:TfoX/Sxy family transcriptional regulator of competence genes